MTHAAVVLAAGGSSRLGRAKQLLTRDGETLVHRAVRLARSTAPARLIVVVGADETTIIHAIADLAPAIVRNARWQDGLAASLHAAAGALAGFDGRVLVVGCDQPALERQHLDDLVVGAATPGIEASATSHQGAPGIPAVVPVAWFRDLPASGDQGFGLALRRLPKDVLCFLDAPALELDIDTPGDVDAAVELGWLDSRPRVA